MGESFDEKKLVEQSSSGDREAFRGLVERYQGRVLRLVKNVVRSQEDAEDIVQESFVKAYVSLESFRGQSSFYTWLYRIAFNMAIDFKRKVARRGGDPVELKEVDKSKHLGSVPVIELPSDSMTRKEQSHFIMKALSELSEEHRAVVVLREVDGMSYEEIAKITGVTKGTIMSRLHYARKRLQGSLTEVAPEGVRSHRTDSHKDEEIILAGPNAMAKIK